MENTNESQKINMRHILFGGGAVLVFALLLVLVFLLRGGKEEERAEVINVSTLEKLIQVSELSTFTAEYNGIAEVPNEKKPDEIDYYVSYEARVNAGIDFEAIEISVNGSEKTIKIDIPEVYITEINVDIASLDYIFFNNKANASSVTQEAFKACEADVRRESEQQAAIYTLAEQNAINILTALVDPRVE